VFLRLLCSMAVLVVATSGRSGEPRTIGPQACATCHAAQAADWAGHAHARAYRSLPPKERNNPLCLNCHASDAARPEAGVTCEACHGVGSEYAEAHLMKDKHLRGYLGLEKVEMARCQQCHQSGHSSKLKPLDLKTLWNKLHHRNKLAPQPDEVEQP
jgi:hypothetical protein